MRNSVVAQSLQNWPIAFHTDVQPLMFIEKRMVFFPRLNMDKTKFMMVGFLQKNESWFMKIMLHFVIMASHDSPQAAGIACPRGSVVGPPTL